MCFPPVDFAEGNDFLADAFKNPEAILVGVVGIVMLGAAVKLLRARPDRTRGWHRTVVLVGYFASGLLYSVGSPFFIAESARRATRAGRGSYVSVSLVQQVDSLAILPDSALMLHQARTWLQCASAQCFDQRRETAGRSPVDHESV